MKRAADTELALPSPPAESSQSPASSSAELHPAGPARKRARSGTSPEERREARAHRNRIAAQNSRDRRKAQFAYLEHRVAELEDENRQLRAGMGLVGLRHVEDDRADEQSQRDRARDRENEELRERIKTLEAGWDAVVKALTASGLPLNIPSVTPPSTKPIVSPSSESSTSPPSQPSTTAFPVLVPPSPVFPISPAPSDASSSSSNTPLFPLDFDDFVPTRHLAAGGSLSSESNLLQLQLELDNSCPTPYQPPSTIATGQEPPPSAMDDVAMEDFLREILAPSPTVPSAPLPTGPVPSTVSEHASTRSRSPSQFGTIPTPDQQTVPPAASAPLMAPTIDWDSEAEMQRLLDMLPGVRPDAGADDAVDFPSALDLELDGWDLGGAVGAPSGLEVGVL